MHSYSYFDCNWLALKINNFQIGKRLTYMVGDVYDLGCGTRPYELDVLQRANSYIGVDWSNTFHELSADIIADLNRPLPLANCIADTVVSFQVLEHLNNPESMTREAWRILRSGGNIFISVPFQWWVHEAPYDYFRYTCYGLDALLSKAGFVDIEIEAVSGFWTMWVLKFNYHTARYTFRYGISRVLSRVVLTPLWFIGQLVAPLLDKLDFNEAETAGYFVTARKP